MKKRLIIFLIILYAILIYASCKPHAELHADETYTVEAITTTGTVRFDNENWFSEPHPKVASFTVADDGSVTGYTVSGIPFSQNPIPNPYGIRVQRFTMQDHYHYIINGEVVYTTTELSQRLVQAYVETGITPSV